MESKTTKEYYINPKEIKSLIVKDLIKRGHIDGDIDMKNVTMVNDLKTETEPGADPHDAYYYEVFNGLKITVKY